MQPDDTFFIISSSKATRIKWSTILNSVNEWDNITDKPFDDYDTVTLGIDVDPNSGTRRLKVNPSITNAVHTHTNKAVLDELSDVEGELYYNDTPIGVSAWDEVTDKPFSTVDENDFEIVDDEISISSTLKTTISNLETDSHTHTNKTVLDKFSEVGGVLEYDGSAVGGGGVTSVNGQTGAVTLTADSVTAVSYNSQSLTTAQQAQVRTNIGAASSADIPTAAQQAAWSAKQDALTFDNTPTSGSTNPVTSDGIYTAIQNSGGGGVDAVRYSVQTLTPAQQAQARTNIGAAASGSGGSAIDYSTVEQDTGVKWVDGKPIYQITYVFNPPVTGSQTYVNLVNVSSLDIDTLIYMSGIEHDATYDNIAMVETHTSNNENLYLTADKATIKYMSLLAMDYLTLRYTKSSDT